MYMFCIVDMIVRDKIFLKALVAKKYASCRHAIQSGADTVLRKNLVMIISNKFHILH